MAVNPELIPELDDNNNQVTKRKSTLAPVVPLFRAPSPPKPRGLFEDVPPGHQIDMSTPESRRIEQLLHNLANPVFDHKTSESTRQVHRSHKATIDVGSVPDNSKSPGRVIKRSDADYHRGARHWTHHLMGPAS
jgi:hypothetical protein